MTRFRPRSRTVLAVVVACLAIASCRTDWSTWGNGVERNGSNPIDQGISTANVGSLHQQWSVDLGGFINDAPVLAIDIPINGAKRDVLYVGTELGEFYAVSTTGQVLWHRNVGSHVANCPDTPGNTFGVQGSATFDRATNRVYVMGGAGKMYALNPSTGAIASGWPVTVIADPVHNSTYGATNLFNGHLYAVTASHCDQGPYHGSVIRVDIATRAVTKYFVGDPNGPDGGGIWGWGGISIDPADGNVYGATGNIFTNPESGDSIIRLTESLQLVAEHAPGVHIGDDDFGSTPTLFQKPGCPPQLVALQKNGSVYLYDRNNIANGYRQRLVVAIGSDAAHTPIPVNEFIGVAAYSPETQLVYVANTTGTPDNAFVHGMLALKLDANCNLALAWQTTAGISSFITGAPSVSNGVVYYADGGANHLHAFNATTGQQLWTSGSEVTAPMFTQPVVVNGQLFEGAYDNHLHAWGLN